VRGGHRGIHPGAIVGVDLIVWLGWIFVLYFMVDVGLVTDSGYLVANPTSSYGRTSEQEALVSELLGKGRAMMAFGSLIL
jgi:hypothetical protein